LFRGTYCSTMTFRASCDAAPPTQAAILCNSAPPHRTLKPERSWIFVNRNRI
jgi:hypothetical protein